MERVSFQVAVQVARSGDRRQAYDLMRQVLLADPGNVFAWLWMSRLVDEVPKQRECYQRALALDPNCQDALEGLEVLRLRELLASSPPPAQAERKVEATRIGERLVQQGFITQAQLDEALAEQRRGGTYLGDRMPLGDILVKRGWLSPQALAEALVTQQQHTSSAPRRLGEHLMIRGFITPEQLARVLAQQAWLRQKGQQVPLGEILVRGGYLPPKVVDEVLDQQSREFFSRFGD